LESSGSPGTRQCLASDLVCAAGAVFVETLTLVLSTLRPVAIPRRGELFGLVLAIID